MDKKIVLESLFDKKIIKILRLFVNNQERKYYLREISRITKVSPASTHRIIKQLLDFELITEHKDKYLKTYVAHSTNLGIFSNLLEDKTTALKEFSDFIKIVEGVERVILHGEEEKDKASVLIVGEGVDQNAIRDKTTQLKQDYKFNIIYLVLLPAQYEQMSSMGLYRGRKLLLYDSRR